MASGQQTVLFGEESEMAKTPFDPFLKVTSVRVITPDMLTNPPAKTVRCSFGANVALFDGQLGARVDDLDCVVGVVRFQCRITTEELRDFLTENGWRFPTRAEARAIILVGPSIFAYDWTLSSEGSQRIVIYTDPPIVDNGVLCVTIIEPLRTNAHVTEEHARKNWASNHGFLVVEKTQAELDDEELGEY